MNKIISDISDYIFISDEPEKVDAIFLPGGSHPEQPEYAAELVKAVVKENASTAQSQEAYLKKYETLVKRYETAAAELERLQSLRTARSQQDKKMALYIRTLKKQPEVMHDWNDTIWTVMIEKAIVHKDGQITFVFRNGTKIKVGA